MALHNLYLKPCISFYRAKGQESARPSTDLPPTLRAPPQHPTPPHPTQIHSHPHSQKKHVLYKVNFISLAPVVGRAKALSAGDSGRHRLRARWVEWLPMDAAAATVPLTAAGSNDATVIAPLQNGTD